MAQASQNVPVNSGEQVHVHAVLPASETAVEACPLQTVVQGVHVG